MAQLVKNYLTALFWPIPHVVSALRLTGKEPPPTLTTGPTFPLSGHFSAMGGSTRNFLIGLFCVYGLYDGDNYPAFGRAAEFSLSWMWPIVLRNILGTWLLCGSWDWWLYFGPVKDKLENFKIFPKYPSFAQMKHDFMFTTLSSIIAAVMEIIVCHYYAIGAIPMAHSLMEKPLMHFLLAITISHWRLPHFWFMHRVMHPWKTDYIPDFGKVLYRHFHSLHHKSYNITAFSGTNMHPVESSLYYSAALMLIPLGVHPALVVGAIVDLGMAAWIGHDGFVWPGGGDYYHELHHLHFDCNYGAPHVPLDYIFGVFAGSKEDVSKLWGKKPSGRDANDTFTQSDSKSNKVE